MMPNHPASTLADLSSRVAGDLGLSRNQKKDMLSAIKIVASWLSVPDLTSVPFNPQRISNRLAELHPKSLGVTPQRFSRIKSDFRRAVRIFAKAMRQEPLTPREFGSAWYTLYRLFPPGSVLKSGGARRHLARAGMTLRPLIVRLAAAGIQPNDVRMLHIEVHFAALDNDPLIPDRRRKTIKGNIFRAWEIARKQIPGWPQLHLLAPGKPPLAIPPSDFSSEFHDDVATFVKNKGVKLGSSNLPENASRLERLRARRRLGNTSKTHLPLANATIESSVYAIRRAASALVRAGEVERSAITSISQVATIEGATALVDEFLGSSEPETSTAREWVSALRSAAVRWRDNMTRRELDEFNGLTAELTVGRPDQMTPRVRERLAQFTPSVILTIDSIPAVQMASVKKAFETSGRPVPFQLAAKARAALGILIEMRVCPRRRTLMLTHLDRNIYWHQDGTAILHYAGGETKTGSAIAADLSKTEVGWLRLYERACLPSLTQPGNRHIFCTPDGTGPLHPSIVARLVCRPVIEATGLPFNLHLFRALLASLLLNVNKGKNNPLVNSLLGHSPHSRVTSRYAEFQSRWASDEIRAIISRQDKTAPTAMRHKLDWRPPSFPNDKEHGDLRQNATGAQ